MRLLRSTIHPDITDLNGKRYHRNAARAIILRDSDILLLYTERYHDYTLPGGGVDEGEDITVALIRELQEETGAQNISNITPFGRYHELRPWYKPEYEVLEMTSHCFTCALKFTTTSKRRLRAEKRKQHSM